MAIPPIKPPVVPVGVRPPVVQKDQRFLSFHLNPTGNVLDPNLLPDVHDSDGQVIGYLDSDRITNTVSAVDVGDSPNSNSGDPLRLAFIKLNNFMEASYWTNERIAKDLFSLDQGIYRLDQADSEIHRRIDQTDSDIRLLFQRTDSDNHEIQALKTYLENTLDSEYVKNAQMLAYIEGRLDSDERAIQDVSDRLTKSVSTPGTNFPTNPPPGDGLMFFKTNDRGLYIWDDVGANNWVKIGDITLNTGTNQWQFQTDGGTY